MYTHQKGWKDPPREELVDGNVVLMRPISTNHAFTSGNIYCLFADYLRGKQYTPFLSGCTVFLTETDHFIPDFMVVCDQSKIKNDGVYGAPDLVVEVLSIRTMKNDKTRKKDVYGRCGVREYWLVNPADKTVEVYYNHGSELVLHDIYAVHPDWMLARMSEEEKATVVTHFKCSLFDDLDIPLDDIFRGLLP